MTPEGILGLALLVGILAVILVGPFLTPYPPLEIGVGPPAEPPSSAHWFGTDNLGRDVFSRVLAGGRSVIQAPLVGIALAFIVGAPLGMIAGYRGGVLDAISTRLLDVLLAVPPLLTVLVILAAFGTDFKVLVISVALVYFPRIARVLRGAVQGLQMQDYVLAAQARGESTRWIVLREIAPNMTAVLFVEVALRITFAIVFVASLNFLGLGVQPPDPNWGLMISEARGIITLNPLAALAPTLAIAVLVISINLLADALTQYFGGDRTQPSLSL
jgi:peptide/nickel transport system permease protein